MKKAKVQMNTENNAEKTGQDFGQQTDNERYEAMLFRIRASLAMCKMMTEDLNALYKEVKAFQEKDIPRGAK